MQEDFPCLCCLAISIRNALLCLLEVPFESLDHNTAHKAIYSCVIRDNSQNLLFCDEKQSSLRQFKTLFPTTNIKTGLALNLELSS